MTPARLPGEHARDGGTVLPRVYFPNDDPTMPPPNLWSSHAHPLFGNWISAIYQITPFDPEAIGPSSGLCPLPDCIAA